MDSRSSPTPHRHSNHLLHPSSSLAYIPQPPIQFQGGYEYIDRMYPLYPVISNLEQDPLLDQNHSVEAIHHEALQRQLEKQQIREDIIRAENKRRQMLEAEVRRELMMERQMLMPDHGYTTEQRLLDGYTSDYRPLELVDDRFPFVDRVDSRATKAPWAFSDSSADKFSFVDRVDGQLSKEPWTYSGLGAERFSLVNRSDFNHPITSEEQQKIPNQSARNEIPSYNPAQPYYSESMIPKVNSALGESLPYNFRRPEVILVPNDPRMRPEVRLAHKDLMPYRLPEVIPASTSSDRYKEPRVFSVSEHHAPGPYSKAMQMQINSAANEIIQDVSNKYASGMKRKATDQPKRSSNNIYKKKKPNGGWSCILCQISASSEKCLDDHFNGRKHRENEEQSREKKKAKIEVEHQKGKGVTKEESLNQTKPQVKNEIKKNNAVESKDNPQSEKPKKIFKYWCKLCQVGAESTEIMNAHKEGKRHFQKLQEKGGAGASCRPIVLGLPSH